MAMTADAQKQIILAFEEGALERIMRCAEKEKRSVTAQLRKLLESAPQGREELWWRLRETFGRSPRPSQGVRRAVKLPEIEYWNAVARAAEVRSTARDFCGTLLDFWARGILTLWSSGTFAEILQGEGWRPASEIVAPAHRGNGGKERKGGEPPLEQAKEVKVGGSPQTLALQLTPVEMEDIDVRLRVLPRGKETRLPQGLNVSVLDRWGDVFTEGTAGPQDDSLELDWTRKAGEGYKISLTLQNETFAQNL